MNAASARTTTSKSKTNAYPGTRIERISFTKLRRDFPVGEAHKDDGLIHRSGREGVVAKVHDICEKLIGEQGKTRKDVLARCRKLGIAEHTTRTQYQRWLNPPKPKAKKAKGKKAAAKKAAK